MAHQMPVTCMNVAGGALERDCNFILLPYCDGAAWAGYREKRVDVPGSPGDQLHMRGIRNLVETVQWAIADHGLRYATQLVISGDSVGGVRTRLGRTLPVARAPVCRALIARLLCPSQLAALLHVDRIIQMVKGAGAPLSEQAWATPKSGYFLDHNDYLNSETSAQPNSAAWREQASFGNWMRNIYHMQNMTFQGENRALLLACKERHRDAPHECFMAPHMHDAVEARFFIFNSKCVGRKLVPKPSHHCHERALCQYALCGWQVRPVAAVPHLAQWRAVLGRAIWARLSGAV